MRNLSYKLKLNVAVGIANTTDSCFPTNEEMSVSKEGKCPLGANLSSNVHGYYYTFGIKDK